MAGKGTDQPERFLVAELIREKILLLTGEEVPYATAVVVERFEEPASRKKMRDGRLPVTKIAAAIFCERAGQKAIRPAPGGNQTCACLFLNSSSQRSSVSLPHKNRET